MNGKQTHAIQRDIAQLEAWLERSAADLQKRLALNGRMSRAQAYVWQLAQIASAEADGEMDAELAAILRRVTHAFWESKE
jgi:hypothetical protein